MPIVPALIISVFIFAPLLGLLLDKVLLRSLAKAPIYARIIGTIGLLVALPAMAQWLVEAVGNGVVGTDLPLVSQLSAAGGTVPGVGPTPPHVFRLGWAGLPNVNLNSDQLAVFVVAAIAAFLLWFVIRRTRVGLEMRASVDRGTLATLRGVSTAQSSAVAWVMTMLLAGLGGVLIGPAVPAERHHLHPRGVRVARRGRAQRPALDPHRLRRRPRCSVSSRTWSPGTATTSCRAS